MRLIDKDHLLKSIECLKQSPWYNSGAIDYGAIDDYQHMAYLERVKTMDTLVQIINDEPQDANVPRVMYREEVFGHYMHKWHMEFGAMWLESKYGALAPCFTDAAARNPGDEYAEMRVWSPFLVGMDTSSIVTWWNEEYYGKTWRCWTSRPTNEQREGTPWQD